jgi:Reverse transcriptase (RNA-dependent DNA polymerase)
MNVYTQDGLEESFSLADLASDDDVGSSAVDSPADGYPTDDEDDPVLFFGDDDLIDPEPFVMPQSARPRAHDSGTRSKLPLFSPDELINQTFVHELPDGQKVRAEVVRKLQSIDAANHQNIQFLLKLGDGEAESIIDYIELCDLLEAQQNEDEYDASKVWTFEKILQHKGPLTRRSEDWNGCAYNVEVLWCDGSTSWEPLNIIAADDAATCSIYAAEHGLTDAHGWNFIKKLARRNNVIKRRASKAKVQRRGVRFKFGVKIPRNAHEARLFQEEAGHTKWTDAEQVELDNLAAYETFQDLGKGAKPPDGYQKIRMIWVYDCKHDFRYKARMVAGGHVTPPVDDSYSSVISLEIMRLTLIVGELNGLELMVGDIGNAYLEAKTKEKIYFIAGQEFGNLEGHTMIIYKALYGLRTSGARFHERLADALRDEGFTASLADPDLWMRDADDCYEYVCVYVDDLLSLLKNADKFYEILRTKYKFKLKGVGPPEYHLGGDFGRDPDGTLYWGAKTYVAKLLANYERHYKGPPAKSGCPMDPKDHPELDTTPLMKEDGVTMYQSLVGALQWAITLGRFDICSAIASLSRFRAVPREGHQERVKRVCGYLRKHPEGAIRFRVQWPENETIFGDMPDHEWQHTVYGDAKEEILSMWPEPKGKPVRLTTFKDANLMHCKVTGKACSGIIHFAQQTPFKWHAKLQDTVEHATFGSELMSARVAVDHIMGTRASLRAMGVPIERTSWLLGDNQSVITQSTVPSSTLTKRHNALAYHRVRWAVAAGIIKFVKIPGSENVSDALTKFLAYHEAWPLLKPVLFWKGETLEPGELSIIQAAGQACPQGECHNDNDQDQDHA